VAWRRPELATRSRFLRGPGAAKNKIHLLTETKRNLGESLGPL
jgi:hypothetical protein